jgi:hypothetical protein
MTSLEERSLKIFDAIFGNQLEAKLPEKSYRIGKTRSGLRCLTVDGIFYIEQNPKKGSLWAKKAQAGHKIMWGLKGRKYVLQVVDGTFKQLKKLE